MNTISSPCIGICQLDVLTDMCVGCFRTRQEVAIWSVVSDGEKKEILTRSKSRRLVSKERVVSPVKREKRK